MPDRHSKRYQRNCRQWRQLHQNCVLRQALPRRVQRPVDRIASSLCLSDVRDFPLLVRWDFYKHQYFFLPFGPPILQLDATKLPHHTLRWGWTLNLNRIPINPLTVSCRKSISFFLMQLKQLFCHIVSKSPSVAPALDKSRASYGTYRPLLFRSIMCTSMCHSQR